MTNNKNWILNLYSWIYTILIVLHVLQVFPSFFHFMVAVTTVMIFELILKKLIKKTLDKEDWKRAALAFIFDSILYIIYIFFMIQK